MGVGRDGLPGHYPTLSSAQRLLLLLLMMPGDGGEGEDGITMVTPTSGASLGRGRGPVRALSSGGAGQYAKTCSKWDAHKAAGRP